MIITAHSRLVIIGDSVTDCGRLRPVGEGPGEALGSGYVAQVDAQLRVFHPETPVRVVNQGIGGDTVRDLDRRWADDVLAQRPDWLAVMIGINDVWRHFDPERTHDAVPPEEFERTYDRLLARAAPGLRGLVLLAPFFVEPDRAEPMRVRMDAYGLIVRRLAASHRAIFVDSQAAFDRVLTRETPLALAPDRVHPSPIGHLVLAREFLCGVGFEWR